MERGLNMRTKSRKNGTKTSAFGSPGRITHDSAKFYSSRLYEGLPKEHISEYIENHIPRESLNKIFCKSSEQLEELPDNSIHLMVTSPPYNVGKEYDKNLTLDEYRTLLKKVWSEVKRILVPRICLT
jgi:site-specific DNA-methyltransferase (adenine-specific)